MAALPQNGKSGHYCWGKEGSTHFAVDCQVAVIAPLRVGCIWSQGCVHHIHTCSKNIYIYIAQSVATLPSRKW